MMKNKKLVYLATVLAVTLVVGVYAGLQLSNTLTASWSVVNTGSELYLSWNPSPDGSQFARGVWYGSYGVRLQNTGTATYNVIVKFRIDAGATMPGNSFKIQYYDGSSWLDLPISGWGDASVEGTFGPSGGFSVGPGYDVTTPLQVMFDGTAPITNYATYIWVEQV
jgi:hypothetical protein